MSAEGLEFLSSSTPEAKRKQAFRFVDTCACFVIAMDGVLEGATVLCVCKLAFSLLFLPLLAASHSPVSFCCCCILIFTNFVVTGECLDTNMFTGSPHLLFPHIPRRCKGFINTWNTPNVFFLNRTLFKCAEGKIVESYSQVVKACYWPRPSNQLSPLLSLLLTSKLIFFHSRD